MIQDVSDQLFQKFSTSMRRELEGPAPSPALPEQAAPAPSPEPPAGPATPPAVSEMTAAAEDVLDVGALGAAAAGRAATRTLRRPGFWIAVLVLAALIYFLLR
jgi:hypothetical protein